MSTTNHRRLRILTAAVLAILILIPTAAFIYNTPAQWCDVNDPVKTGFFGNWWRCSNPAPAPSFNELFAVRCTDVATNTLIDDSGIMQVSVKMVTPPTAPNCSSYTLTVHVFANAQ